MKGGALEQSIAVVSLILQNLLGIIVMLEKVPQQFFKSC